MLAAVDLGSNSFRLHIGTFDGERIRIINSAREPVRLGAGLDSKRNLSQAAIQNAVACLARFAQILQSTPLTGVRVVATNTVRVARNGSSFLPLFEKAIGYPIEIISGEEEGRLIYMGVASTLNLPLERRLVIDIGGGSTEFVLGTTKPTAAISTNVGCVRMTERHLVSDPATPEQIAAATSDIDAAIDQAYLAVPIAEAKSLIGLAGSVTTVAALALGLAEYDSEAIHGSHISASEVHRVTQELLNMTRAQRATLGPMHEGRIDVIGSGALVLDRIMARTGLSEVVVSERDILDGIARASVSSPS